MQVQVQVQVHPLPNKATGRSEQGIASPDVRVGLACGWADGRFDIVSLSIGLSFLTYVGYTPSRERYGMWGNHMVSVWREI